MLIMTMDFMEDLSKLALKTTLIELYTILNAVLRF